MSYKYTQLSGYSMIGGTRYDISRASVHYGINSIPVASIGVATGSPAYGQGAASELIQTFSRKQSMQIFIDSSAPSVIPGGSRSMMLFDGTTAFVGLVSEPGLRGIQVNGSNWLMDLASSGAFASNRTAHAFWELVPQVTMLSTSGITTPTISMEGVASALAVSKGDLFAVLDQLVKYVTGLKAANQQFSNVTALNAWKRITGDIQFSFDVSATVEEGVKDAVTAAYLALHNGGVLLDSILSLSEPFMFRLVPTVNTAHIVAYTPMLQDPVVHLTPADYVYVSQLQSSRRNIAGLVLIDNNSLTSSAEMQIKDALSIFVVNEPNGILDGVPLPGWLHTPIATSTTTNTYDITAGIYGRAPNRVATAKQAANAKATATAQWSKNYAQTKEVGNNYAQMALGDRLFAPNSLSIKGPLRTDIVPGTVISVDIPSDVSRTTKVVTLYGYVTGVTLEIDSEKALAATTINLSHVRNKSDNVKFGSYGNALYTNSFSAKNLLPVGSSGGNNALGGGSINLGGTSNALGGGSINLGGSSGTLGGGAITLGGKITL